MITESLNIAKRISEGVNPPFLGKSIKHAIDRELDEIHRKAHKSYEITRGEDAVGVYIRLKCGTSDNKLVLVSHLDHPTIILNNRGKGAAVGDTFSNGASILKDGNYPVKLYDSEGRYLRKSQVEVKKGGTSLLEKSGPSSPMDKNVIAAWDLINYEIKDKYLKMRSCDNLVSVSIQLALLATIVKKPLDCDLTIVFPAVEEVLQLSMVDIAQNRSVATTKFDESTIFISIDVSPLRVGSRNQEWIEKLNLDQPAVSKGPFIYVADTDLVFGAFSNNRVNLAEELLLASVGPGQHQYSLADGRSDLTPLSLFTNFGNMAELLIPCLNVHNIDQEGNLACEMVKIEDVLLAERILIKAVETLNSIPVSQDTISRRLRRNGYSDRGIQKRMRKRWLKAYSTNIYRLRGGFFYPESFKHFVLLMIGKVRQIFI